MNTATRLRSPSALSLAVLLVSVPAIGQEDIERARVHADAGYQAYDAGRYAEAVEQFLMAESVARSPTLALHTARALVAQGKWVEAAKQYELALDWPVADEELRRSSQEKSQREAEIELRGLLVRIPLVTVTVVGALSDDVILSVDDVPVAPAWSGVPLMLNPGVRRIEGRTRGHAVKRNLTARSGERQSLVLDFGQWRPRVAPSQASQAAELPATDVATPRGPGLRTTLGWVSLGVGAAGLCFGGINGLKAHLAAVELVRDGCDSDGHCYADQRQEVRSYEDLRRLAFIGYAVGIAGVATGGYLLLGDSSTSKASRGASVAFWAGVGAAGINGWFDQWLVSE